MSIVSSLRFVNILIAIILVLDRDTLIGTSLGSIFIILLYLDVLLLATTALLRRSVVGALGFALLAASSWCIDRSFIVVFLVRVLLDGSGGRVGLLSSVQAKFFLDGSPGVCSRAAVGITSQLGELFNVDLCDVDQ